MKHAELATGVDVTYKVVGPADAEPLLLLAPLGRDHHLWDIHLPRFSQEFRCIAPDYRGTGGSDRPDAGYSMSQFARDVASLLDTLGIESTHVAGSSMGAAVALELALEFPGRVTSLSLYTPWARTDANLREAFAMLRALTEHAPALDAERAVAWLVFSPEFLNENWQTVDGFARTAVASPEYAPQHAALGHIDAAIAHDVLDRLDSIDIPTLVIAGERDRFIPHNHAEQVRDAIPGADYRLLSGPGSSHGLTVERPDAFVELALDFLRLAGRR